MRSSSAGQMASDARQHFMQARLCLQQALSAQPLIQMKSIGTAPPMPMTAHHQQNAVIRYAPAKTPDDLIEEPVKLQDSAGILIATRIGRIAWIAIAPEKMLRVIEGIELDKEEM